LSSLILTPISAEAHCGIDTKYDDTFLSIEAEIDKANSLVEGSVTNWRLVSELSETLLCERSKDIKVASWWGFAQYKLNGFEGLYSSLTTLNTLMNEFGQSLFPLSNRVKFNALQWFETTLMPHLIQERRLTLPNHQSDLFLELFKSFQSSVISICEIESPLFKEVVRLLEEDKKLRDENTKKSLAPVQPTETSSNEIASDADAIKLLNSIKKNTEMLSRYWRGNDMGDLRPLRMTRMISWLEIDGLPESQNSKTMLNPPSFERIEEIEIFEKEGKLAEAFEIVENLLLRSPFWLEGHYKSYKLLESAQHTQAALETKNMLMSFMKSNEGLGELNFRDGTPFVPSELKTWMSDDISMGGLNPHTGGEKENEKYDHVRECCFALLKKKDTKGAMDLLQHSYRSAQNKEEQFRWRLLHAEVSVEALKPQMAIALIEELEKDIAHYHLEEWQPDLAGEVYKLLLNSFNRTQLDHTRLENAYQGLCRTNTAEAVDIKF